MITTINMHCPYCTKVMKITEPKTSGKILGDHVVDAHPDIARKLQEKEENQDE